MTKKQIATLVTGYLLMASALIEEAQRDLRGCPTLQLSQSGVCQNEAGPSEEEAESPNAKERESRRAKNIRYNAGGSDLTARNPNAEYFVEYVLPRGLPLIPSSESAVIVTGTVIRMQPYLSEDHSRIYTEITIKVEDVLKGNASKLLLPEHTLIMEQLGGALKLKSGRIVRDDIIVEGLGKPCIGKRYVLFAQRVNKGNDLRLIRGYELRNGKVFTLDVRVNKPISTYANVPETFSDEATFLDAVRQEIRRSNTKTN